MLTVVESILRWVGFAAGVLVFGTTAVALVAHGFGLRRSRAARGAEWAVSAGFDSLLRRVSDPDRAERILGFRGPAVAVCGLLVLPLGFVAAIALLLLPWEDPTPLGALRAAGAAFFGLGLLADAAVPTAVAVLGAASGVLFVVLAVAFVVRLHHLLARREETVAALAVFTGLPPWGPEVLARFGEGGAADGPAPAELYRRARRWAAVLGPPEGETLLLEFHRPGAGIDPITATAALMDAAALDVVTRPDADHGDARLLLQTGGEVLAGIADALGMATPAVRPAMLTEEDFAVGLTRLRESGFVGHACPADAWERFVRLRRSYAAAAVGIARRLDSPPAPWSGERRRRPHGGGAAAA